MEQDLLTTIWHSALQIGVFVFFLFVGKKLFLQFKRNISIQEELVHHDNLAFAISIVGYYIGLVLGLVPVLSGESEGIITDLINLSLYGLLVLILLTLSAGINDKIVFRFFSIDKEIFDDHNPGTGLIMAANYISSGLIIYGAMDGAGPNFFPEMYDGVVLSGLITSFVFWSIGQVLILLITIAFDKLLPYDLHDEVEKDNVAVSIAYSGMMIAVAMIVFNGIRGDFYSWSENLTGLGIELAIGLVVLVASRIIVDKILIPGRRITDELVNQEKPNLGIGLIEGLAYCTGAFLVLMFV